MIQSIIIDFDGVVVDSFEMCLRGMNEIGNSLTAENYRKQFSGNIFEVQEKEGTVDEGFNAIYAKNILECDLRKGIVEVVEYLASKNIFLGIISSSPESSIRPFLKKHSLEIYFSFVWGEETSKKKSEKFELFLQSFDYVAESVVFITDTAGDVREAREKQIKSVAIEGGFQTREQLEESRPHAQFSTISEMMLYLQSIV